MSWLSTLTDWIMGALAAIGIGAGNPTTLWHGYVEGEYVRVAAPLAGRLERLAVARGDQVEEGTLLFAMDLTEALAERNRAIAARAQARANLDDLRKGKRDPELDVIAAQKDQAEAALRLSEVILRRQESLLATGNTPRERVDEARSAHARDKARVAELSAQLEVGRLAAREDDIRAAEAAVAVAEATLVKAGQALADMAPVALQASLVEETYYRQGEWVQAGAPVVSLLPPGNVKVRFYVPEPQLASLAVGQTVTVRCDSCQARLNARITFIAPAAEYTPPVIYSNESRAKLVYRVEARPDPANGRLHPGQPVDVAPAL
jgi:HlyD family secretion protein